MENIKNMKSIRETDTESLFKEIAEISASIFAIKSKCAITKSVARPDIIKKMKISRARMLTEINARNMKKEAE